MSKIAKKTSMPAGAPSVRANANASDNAGSESAEKAIFYVVYVDTYVSDDQILPRGIYKTDTPVERLDNSRPQYVKKFEGEISDKVLHEIAETLRVSVTDVKGNYRKSSEILAEIVKEI